MIIIDLSFIRFNLYAGVSKYAYRLLDYIVEEGKSDDYILLLNIVSENKIREWYPQFKTISIGSQALLKYYNPQNEMFRLLGTKRSFSQNETFFFSHPYPALFRLISHF